jgi:hypothetical protein
MARYSSPETRAYARDKAEIIGQAERIIYGELRDWATRVAYHRATPAVAVVGFFGFIILAHWVVGQINL